MELDDEQSASNSVVTAAIEAREKSKEIANKKVQQYNDKQKTVYEKNACAISYNVGGTVDFEITFAHMYHLFSFC